MIFWNFVALVVAHADAQHRGLRALGQRRGVCDTHDEQQQRGQQTYHGFSDFDAGSAKATMLSPSGVPWVEWPPAAITTYWRPLHV